MPTIAKLVSDDQVRIDTIPNWRTKKGQKAKIPDDSWKQVSGKALADPEYQESLTPLPSGHQSMPGTPYSKVSSPVLAADWYETPDVTDEEDWRKSQDEPLDEQGPLQTHPNPDDLDPTVPPSTVSPSLSEQIPPSSHINGVTQESNDDFHLPANPRPGTDQRMMSTAAVDDDIECIGVRPASGIIIPRNVMPNSGNTYIGHLISLAVFMRSYDRNAVAVAVVRHPDQYDLDPPQYVVFAWLDGDLKLGFWVQEINLEGTMLPRWSLALEYEDLLRRGELLGIFKDYPHEEQIKYFLDVLKSRLGSINGRELKWPSKSEVTGWTEEIINSLEARKVPTTLGVSTPLSNRQPRASAKQMYPAPNDLNDEDKPDSTRYKRCRCR